MSSVHVNRLREAALGRRCSALFVSEDKKSRGRFQPGIETAILADSMDCIIRGRQFKEEGWEGGGRNHLAMETTNLDRVTRFGPIALSKPLL